VINQLLTPAFLFIVIPLQKSICQEIAMSQAFLQPGLVKASRHSPMEGRHDETPIHLLCIRLRRDGGRSNAAPAKKLCRRHA
jgi:hypothetical protein